MAGAEGVAVWRVMFWAESLPQGTLILTASPLPLLLNLRLPPLIDFKGLPCEGRDNPGSTRGRGSGNVG